MTKSHLMFTGQCLVVEIKDGNKWYCVLPKGHQGKHSFHWELEDHRAYDSIPDAEAEGTDPSTDVVRGLIVANLAKLDRTVTTLAELVKKVEKDVQRLEKRVDGVEVGLSFQQRLESVDE